MRLDYTKDTGRGTSPRASIVRQDVTHGVPRTTLKGGVGLFSQPPQPQETNAVFGTPGLTDQRAIHYDVGVEREFTRNIEASLEGFYKQLDYLVDAGRRQRGQRRRLRRRDAHPLQARRALLRLARVHALAQHAARRAGRCRSSSSQFDETHILTVLGSYRLGRGWESARASA